MITKQYRCIVSVPVEYTVEARNRDDAMAHALRQLQQSAPHIELHDGQSFYPTKLAVEEAPRDN